MKPKIRKRVVAKLLSGHGGGTPVTTSWDSLDESIREQIQRDISLGEGEEFLLGSFVNTSHWCVATTERFSWKYGQDKHSLTWAEIKEADIREEEWIEVSRGRKPKTSLEELLISDTSGHIYTLRLEPGKGFLLIWSLLVAFTIGKRDKQEEVLQDT